MKKLLLSSAALVGLTAGALAADLPARRAPPAPFVAVPVFTWTGFYVGVNAGYGFSDRGDRNRFNGGLTTFQPSAAGGGFVIPANVTGFNGVGNNNGGNDGFIGGGQIGYNYQFGQFVIGLEADIQYSDLGGGNRNNNQTTVFAATPTAFAQPGLGIVGPAGVGNVALFNDSVQNMEYFGTVRGRVGFAIDRLLVFGTGGLAYRDGGSNNNRGFGVPAGFFASPNSAIAAQTFINQNGGNRNASDIGYAVGGGIEYAFTPNLSAKIEGLYVNFEGDNNRTVNNVVGVTNTGAPVIGNRGRGQESDFALVRAGLNYKFNLF
jgi:outer membrane immunogenic protein